MFVYVLTVFFFLFLLSSYIRWSAIFKMFSAVSPALIGLIPMLALRRIILLPLLIVRLFNFRLRQENAKLITTKASRNIHRTNIVFNGFRNKL
jgi:hypothetical protein